MWHVPLAQVLPRPQVIFPFKTWFFGIYLKFQRQKKSRNNINISHILNPNLTKFIELNKSRSSRSFQQHQRHIPILLKFSATI
jgi:hypothetical protein